LEEERDSLPGLLIALRHEPSRFEDFTAQPIPSREVCLRGVQAADVYLLLIGPVYGDALLETGLSPTHEEYNAALTKGIPRLAFRKEGVDLEPAQADFVQEFEAYSTGLFRTSFVSAVDLQAKVSAALAHLPDPSQSAQWSPLPVPVTVAWRDTWTAPPPTERGQGAEIELHAVPIDEIRRSVRQLRDHSEGLVQRLRALGLVATSAAIDGGSDASAAWALPAQTVRTGGWNEVRPEAILGVRMSASGQRSVWQQLPADTMGSLLDADELPTRIARLLRLLGGIAPLADTTWAIGIGLHPSVTLSLGPIASLGHRSSAQGFGMDQRHLRLEPDEAVGPGGLDTGADEVGAVLARNLLDAFTRKR
jgi:hypothetical protein